MDETDDLIYQVGLLLTQTRIARRTLEDIERQTATYATFAFTSVIAAGRRFGEPPLFDGALKVHVVNINDLGPGGGFGALIEGLLGGAGRFVGNLFGGLIGGTISTYWLLKALPTIHNIAARIERILGLLGMGAGPPEPPPGRGQPVGGSNLVTMLESIGRAVNGLTGLFLAAGGRPEQAAQTSTLPSTPEGERWQRFLESTTTLLSAVGRVADGLVIVLPVAIGSIASLISRLPNFRIAIAETLQFLLRNLLLLRGALTVTFFDTLALVARVGARTLDLLSTALTGMLSAVFDTVRDALRAVLAFGAVLGDGIKRTIDALLDWLVPTIDTVLRNIGNTRAFRVVVHLVRILPAILPPIFELAKDRPIPGGTAALERAAALPFLGVLPAAGARGPGAAPTTPPRAPDIAAIIGGITPRLNESLDRLERETQDRLRTVAETGERGLTTLASELSSAATAEIRQSETTLDRHLGEVRQRSTELAAALIVPEEVEPQTGLEAIADAYESWLSGGGLETLLGTITRHFQSAEGRAGVPERIVEGAIDRPRATIQIDEVVIELAPEEPALRAAAPVPSELGPGDFPLPAEGDDIERYARMWRDYRMRGGSRELLPALA